MEGSNFYGKSEGTKLLRNVEKLFFNNIDGPNLNEKCNMFFRNTKTAFVCVVNSETVILNIRT